MKKGEKIIFGLLGLIAIVSVTNQVWQTANITEEDPGIPYYSTASIELKNQAGKLLREHSCKECHKIFFLNNLTQNVPSPSLDGIGSLREEAWFYDYFSAEDPQEIIPSRLKARFQMPSLAHLPEEDRRILAAYMSSLKVEDWYLEETRKAAYEKRTGEEYQPE